MKLSIVVPFYNEALNLEDTYLAITRVLDQFYLKDLKSTGQMRKSLLTRVERDNPVLPNRVIIYTQSDRPYYGMSESEKILPVQSGFGRMVMVWYQQKQVFPIWDSKAIQLDNITDEIKDKLRKDIRR